MLTEDQVRAIYAESMKHRDPVPYIHRAIEAAVRAALVKQESLMWSFTGSTRLMGEREARLEAKRCGGTTKAFPLYRAPVVRPDMVMEGFKAACAFIDSHVADPDTTDEMCKTCAEFMRMREMIAAAMKDK